MKYISVLFTLAIITLPLFGDDTVPISGKKSKKIELIDEVMLKFLKQINNCTTASISVSKKNRTIVSRSYGWLDEAKTKPAPENVIIGIASCEKPITKAAIKYFFKKKRIDLDSSLLDLLKIKAPTQNYDKRIHDITINHILDHKAGWGADPLSKIPRKIKVHNLAIDEQLSHVLSKSLVTKPGSKDAYCNFGYDLMRYILTSLSKSSPEQFFITSLPRVDNDFYSYLNPINNKNIVWNIETGGPISASSSTLCSFMDQFWLTGEERKSGRPTWVMYGSLDGSTAIMDWRSDGYNVAILFNSRGGVTHDQIRDKVNATLNLIYK
ncbi:serine hydrolase [Lentisphaera profundi]|uniref:Serine hydrolase n=1 Tax=Lentisphaera profundi TaxID=1658616 RepID=A0ABY7VSZ5_9BACT|nr:serine hydrolase domain-containing protein [Lentisphaera profundi]WDE96874.1 serine hydrolase [Lentisphaera profundi]